MAIYYTEGVLFDVVGLRLSDAAAIATAIVAVGMITILYALYGGSKEMGG